jgi:hypothetical protein
MSPRIQGVPKPVKGFVASQRERGALGDVRAAISREKQVKGWARMRKIALIESVNRDWKNLSGGWYGREAANTGRTKRPERDSSLRSE